MAEKKHLFGTSEKSDFILNMTEQGTKKLCGMYCIIAMIVITLAAIPYYFTKNVVDFVETEGGMEFTHYLSEKTIYWVSTLMIGMGLIGYLIFLIGKMKNEVSLKDNKALLWLAAIMLMSVVSALCAENLEYAFTGYYDRSEGLLSILGYFGFFAAAVTVTDDGWKKRVSDVLVAIGVFNSVAGIIQSIPATAKLIPNWFEYLFTGFGNVAGEGEEIINGSAHAVTHSASGFAGTPFALGALLTVAFAAAFAGFVFDESKLRKALYAAGGILMTVCAALTDVVPSVIGIGCSAVIILIIALVSKLKKSGGAALIPAVSGFVCTAAVFLIMLAAGQLDFRDEQVIFTDCYERLSISAGTREDTSTWIYPYLWDDGLYVAENNMLLGTGPDNWGTMYKLGATIDRSYNEYIDVAMQRGFITLVMYLIFLAITLKKALSSLSRFICGELNWTAAAVMTGVTAYLVQAFFNISTISSSPFFWICAGLVWSFEAKKRIKAN